MLATLSFGADVASAEKTTAEWTTHVRRFFSLSYQNVFSLVLFGAHDASRDPCVRVSVNTFYREHIHFI
jgi:hypothetical protein